jgi:RNA polymerase sigma factor (sigma-70 family)
MHVLAPPPEAPESIWHGAQLEDESLVEFARQPAGGPALDELLRRFSTPTGRLVRRLAIRSGFQDADCMDVQQEAVFWTMEAIRQFRTDDVARTHGCRFRTFLHRVVTVRFIDYLRRQRHRQRRVALAACVGDGASPPDGSRSELSGHEMSEVRQHLEQELDRLGDAAQQLWALLVRGVSLRQAAVELGVSYDTAKRQRRHLLARLRVAVAG